MRFHSMPGSRFALVAVLLLAVFTAAPLGAANLADRPQVADALTVLDLWLDEQIAAGAAPGLSIAIVHDQELVWSSGYGFADLESRRPATASTLYRIGSVTKLFTATAVLQLRDGGKLDLDDPVAKHLPEFRVRDPFPASTPITLRHLLTQTSGLTRDAPFPYWTTHVFPSRDEVLASLAKLELTHRPGETYKYSNLGMALLGLVVERRSGLAYADYMRQRIFEPLGMTSSTAAPSEEHHRRRATSYYRKATDGTRRAFDYYDMEGLAAAGNVVSSVEDLAAFARLQFRDGAAGGAQILAGTTLREMQRPQFVYPSFEGGRGLGFAVSRSDGVTFVAHGGWIGGNRTHLLLVPSEKIGVIVAANADDADPSAIARKAYDVMAPAISAATAAPEPSRAADPAWQRYTGTYTDPWGWEYEVLVHDGQLAFYEHSYPPDDDPLDGITRLVPVSEHVFRMPDGEPVVFEIGAGGRVERVRRRFEYLTPVER
ncbi:MAG TPA: serine hydrolase domain-containing protein [Thermoanaerobaculia bacterium]|nr:serine hydrolase domain-containing protein [Thermoanaerobaculia bacterium]